MPSLRSFIGCFAMLCCLSGKVALALPPQTVVVVRQGNAYVVDTTLIVPVSVRQAWNVLTDFEHFSQWIPNVTRSRVVQRGQDVAVVEQTGTTKVGPASLTYTTEGSVKLSEPRSIQSKQLKGNMRRLESIVVLRPQGRTTRLDYHLEVTPGALAAAVLTENFLRAQVREQWDAISEEMLRRAHKS